MAAPLCAYCGRPIHSDDKCRTNYRGICHASEATCVEELRAALTASTSALASTEADRDRYRAVLVALRGAEARYAVVRDACADFRAAARQAEAGLSARAVALQAVADAAADAAALRASRDRALAAAIAAVEEDTK